MTSPMAGSTVGDAPQRSAPHATLSVATPARPAVDDSKFGLAKYAAYGSALCFVLVGFVIILLFSGAFAKSPDVKFDDYKRLDKETLARVWKWRRDTNGARMFIDLFGALAWMLLVIPVLSMNRLLGAYRSGKTVMVSAFLFGAITVGMELLFNLGRNSISTWITDDFTLNEQDIRAFELARLATQGQTLWIFAVDWLLMGVGMAMTARLAKTTPFFNRKFITVSYVTSAMATVAFILEIARLGGPSNAFGVLSALSGILTFALIVVCIPLWLVWLGAHLGRFRDSDAARTVSPLMPEPDL